MTDWLDRARRVIPGATQLLSKRPDRFLPGGWPSHFRTAKGIDVSDTEGRVYEDWSLFGIGACPLGYGDPAVDAAARKAIEEGVACTLNPPEEVEYAEAILHEHPWADMARFTRSAGEALTVAVRIARAHTGRDGVAVCGYHGWHDWYLAANLGDSKALDGHLLPGLPPAGVPRSLRGTTHPFHHGDADALEAILRANSDGIAAIVMEPLRDKLPDPSYLERIRRLATEHGAVLIVDEVTAGLRLGPCGAHMVLGLHPDMAVLGKAIGNGYAMAAVLGRRDVMEDAQSTFISSTNWTERIGPAAALATLTEYKRRAVEKDLKAIGSAVQAGWRDAAADAGLDVTVWGLPALSHFRVEAGEQTNAAHTLFSLEMLKRGYLASDAFYASAAHQAHGAEDYLSATSQAFQTVQAAISSGDVTKRLSAGERSSGFARLT